MPTLGVVHPLCEDRLQKVHMVNITQQHRDILEFDACTIPPGNLKKIVGGHVLSFWHY